MNKTKLQKNVPLKKIKIRLAGVAFGFLLLFALLSARAFELHLTDNHKLNRLAKTQYKRRVVVAPKRGTILDRNGETLAIDVQVESVYAMPHKIEDEKVLVDSLSSTLSISKEKIKKRIKDKKKKFVWIKRRIAEDEGKKLKEQNFKCVGFLPEYKRFYPNGILAANLLGAVGYDAEALSGLELTFDKILKSQDPPVLVEQDAKGRSYAPYALVGRENPKQIVLTLDKTIQYIAEKELHAAVKKAKAIGGVAIVLEAETGALLGMAVRPSFDPNEYYKYAFKNWRNRAVSDIYEPGSTFKAFTAAAALESKVIQPQQKLHCENGAMKVGSYTIHDHHGYGSLSLLEIIKYSSNICSFKLAQKVGKKGYLKFIKALGFGSKTGIDAPGELPGLMASEKQLRTLQLGTMGFGQGISVTPLQLAMAYGSLANGGFLMKPTLAKEIQDANGNTLKKFGPQIVRQAMEGATAKQTVKLLESVLEKGGTGTQARPERYSAAGKTGTAQKVIEGKKGYAKNKYVASFVGLAPAQNPKLVVLVSIDEPKGAYYGGIVSGPVFKKIMEQSLAYLKVPPDTQLASRAAPPVPAKVSPKKSKGVKKNKDSADTPISNKVAKKPEKKESANEPVPAPDNKELNDLQPIPDLTGLSVREALREAQAKNYKIRIEGSGICNQQEPPAGNTAPVGSSISLICSPPI